MTKEQILQAIKANIGTTDNRFDKTISNFIDRNKLTEVADADLKLDQYTDSLKFFYDQTIGLANHEIAEARKQWMQQNPAPTPAPTPAPDPAPNPQGMSPEVKAILEQQKQMIEALSSQMKANQQQALADSIRAAVINRGKELKANTALWEMAVKQTTIADGATTESIEAVVKPAYEALQKSVFGSSGEPYGKTDGGQDKEYNFDEFFKSKGIGKSE